MTDEAPEAKRKGGWLPLILVGVLAMGVLVPVAPPLLVLWQYHRDFGDLDVHLLPETYRRGNVVVTQLMNYRADHGAFPPDLYHLARMGYAGSIEPPTWGDREWVYDGGLSLRVERYGNSYPGIYFSGMGWKIGGERVRKDWREPATSEELDTRRIGYSIIDGITRFRNTEGRVPATLDELVESPHMGAIETTAWGVLIWDYKRHSPVPVDPSRSDAPLPYWDDNDYPLGFTLDVRSEPAELIGGGFDTGYWTLDS